MDFELSDRSKSLLERLREFMAEHVYPNEDEIAAALDGEVNPQTPFPDIMADLRRRARHQGLWNLFLPAGRFGSPGLTNLEYGGLCEEMGRSSYVAPMVFNCQAPDTGNMEILAEHATSEQRTRWLEPMLEGEIRSCYAMTEPDTAGSDPTGLECRASLEDGQWVIDGRKWWTTNALGAAFAIAMTVTDPDAAPHQRASMILVPLDTPGFKMIRPISHMGHRDGPGHWEIAFEDCTVPAENLLGERQAGFKIAQDRLGPGRIHHCMRLIGGAERALELMCQRARERKVGGEPLADKQFIQEFIATSRTEIEQARLLTQYAAWKLDTVGNRNARQELSMTKLVVPSMALGVIDRAIQVWGGAGISDDTPLSAMYRFNRMLRIGDGADEVHKTVIAKLELRKAREPAAVAFSVSGDYNALLVERVRDGVVLVTLNRPERLNAITFEMFDEFHAVCGELESDRDARVVIITGAGRGFCSGLDLDEAETLPEMSAREMMLGQERWGGSMAAIRELPQPVIAAVNGPATGGGLAVALAADLRVASSEARFNAAFVRIGLTSGDIGVSWALPRLIGLGRAAEIMLTGRFVDAEEAARIGLVNRVVAREHLLDATFELADQIVSNTPFGVTMSKRVLNLNVDAGSMRSALEVESRGQTLATRGDDFREALHAFREKRAPNLSGS